jgi:hypothetical protein
LSCVTTVSCPGWRIDGCFRHPDTHIMTRGRTAILHLDPVRSAPCGSGDHARPRRTSRQYRLVSMSVRNCCRSRRNRGRRGARAVWSVIDDCEIGIVRIQVVPYLDGVRPARYRRELIPVAGIRLYRVEIQAAAIGHKSGCCGARNASRVPRDCCKDQQNKCEQSDLHNSFHSFQFGFARYFCIGLKRFQCNFETQLPSSSSKPWTICERRKQRSQSPGVVGLDTDFTCRFKLLLRETSFFGTHRRLL